MICDVHAHYLPRSFSDYMGDRFWPPVGKATRTSLACHPFSDLPEDIIGRFDVMDAAGVEKQVLSPHWPPYLPDEAQGVQAIKLLNDGYAELAHRHPKRISSYVSYRYRISMRASRSWSAASTSSVASGST